MNRQPRQSGQALLAATFALVVLLGAAGLAIDMGYMRYQKRLQQSAADSAALAGAAELSSGSNAQVTTAATNDTALNGFTDGFTGADPLYHVTINVNPTFAFGASTGVQVQVQVTQPTFFMRIFGVNSTTVTASAVAIPNNSTNCIYALSGGGGITNSGNLTASNCGVADAENLANSGTINATPPATIAVHTALSGGGGITPSPVTGAAQAGDPLFRLNPPGTGGCAVLKGGADPGIIVGATGKNPTPTITINPGTYCSGIKITNRANVVLTSGTYVVTGTKVANGINWNGSGSVTGNGVTIYIKNGAGPVQVNNTGGNEQLTLTALTSTSRAGILFYQDPNYNFAATINGKAGSTLTGALYFPSAKLNLSNINASAYTITVAKTLAFAGNVTLGSNYSSLPGGSPIKNAVLVE